jgi:MFS family permease
LTRLLVGEFVSSIGDWLYLVALLVVVERVSGDPLLLGVVGAARVLPYVVLSVPAGYVADHYERRLVLLVTDAARAVIMLVLAWLVATDGPLAAIVALAILATCFSTFFGPTLGSYLPALARDETELGPANSAWATLDNLAFVIGPSIAGLLLATSGVALAFLLNAGSFLVVIVVLWSLPGERTKAPVPAPSIDRASDVSSAGRATVETPTPDETPRGGLPTVVLRPLVALASLDSATSAVFGGLSVLTVVIATHGLGVSDDATGPLNAALGVGGLVGAIAAGGLVLRPRLAPSLLVGGVVLAAGLLVLAGAVNFSTGIGLALAGMAFAAAGNLLVDVVATTLLQRAVPDHLRGRAIGSIATVSTLAFAAGSLVIPVLADRFGIALVLAISAAAIIATALFVAATIRGMPDTTPEGTALLSRLRDLPVFAGVPIEALDAAARRMRPLELAPGAVLMRQGEPADRCYFVLSGRLSVRRAPDGDPANSVTIDHIGPDEVVGELGLLRGAPRSATIVAEEATRLLALEGSDFLELVSSAAGLRGRLLDLRRVGLAADLAIEDAAR